MQYQVLLSQDEALLLQNQPECVFFVQKRKFYDKMIYILAVFFMQNHDFSEKICVLVVFLVQRREFYD